jgi:hypothetical protein
MRTEPIERGWGNVPARDPNFAGREEQLAAVRAGLLAGGPVVVHAVRGMGGAGKSQVAIEYAHRHADDYALTWWLDCENKVLLGQQYAELAIHLGHVTRDAPPEEMRRAAVSALRHHPSWLLVFDNVTDPATIRQWLPGEPGHVLITSYKDYWNGLATATTVPVGPLPRAESVGLLRRRVPGFADGDAGALAAANRALGRYGSARHYSMRALTRRRSLHGDDHPGALTAASDLADILSDMGVPGLDRAR